MFYTVVLPCTLWFFDKRKAESPRGDKVLFLDARHIFRQIDRAHRDWTEAQIGFLANVVRWRQTAQGRAQVRLAIEDELDDGLPRAYTPELYEQKCSAVFEHLFETRSRENEAA